MAKFELTSITTDYTPYKIFGYELVPRQPIIIDVPDEGITLEDGESIELSVGQLFLMLNHLALSSSIAKYMLDESIKTKLSHM